MHQHQPPPLPQGGKVQRAAAGAEQAAKEGRAKQFAELVEDRGDGADPLALAPGAELPQEVVPRLVINYHVVYDFVPHPS